MPKAEKDLFEDFLAKMMALPIIGVVYVVFRFWHVVPRMLSFTGAWLLVFFLVDYTVYTDLRFYVFKKYGSDYLFVIPIILSYVPIAITWSTWRKGLEASIYIDSWFL